MDTQKPKPHREFFRILLDQPGEHDTRWVTVPGTNGLIDEMILADNLDTVSQTGSRTTLARWRPGALLSKPIIHDFHEEVFIAQGDLIVGCDEQGNGGEIFNALTYACRPPQVWHGPFKSQTGCIMFEIQYY